MKSVKLGRAVTDRWPKALGSASGFVPEGSGWRVDGVCCAHGQGPVMPEELPPCLGDAGWLHLKVPFLTLLINSIPSLEAAFDLPSKISSLK